MSFFCQLPKYFQNNFLLFLGAYLEISINVIFTDISGYDKGFHAWEYKIKTKKRKENRLYIEF